MVRSILLVIVLTAGCGKRAVTGPAWPAPSTTAEDGGESLEPRSTSVATSLERAPDVKQNTDEAAPPAPGAGSAAPPAAAPDDEADSNVDPPVLDDVIFSEEIIIDDEEE